MYSVKTTTRSSEGGEWGDCVALHFGFLTLQAGMGPSSRAEYLLNCALFEKSMKLLTQLVHEQSRRELATEEQQSASTMQTRSAHSYPQSTELTCFFCNEPAGSAGLHTYNIDANVRRCAVEVEDTALLAKLAAGDMIVIDAMYHHNCLFSLYNRAIARQAAPKDDDGDDSCLHGIAFAELVAFLEDMKSDEDSAPATEDEYAWLSKVKTALENSTIDGWISWSAYHADMQQAIIPPPAINALLPLFLDNAHSVAMIQHSMDVIKAAIQDLNPGQTPVLAADQPL